MNRRLFVLAAFALSGCAGGVRVLAPPAAAFPELEPLYGAVAGRDALTITVASNGCTAKADFAVHVERKDGAVTLAFGRKRLDTSSPSRRARRTSASPGTSWARRRGARCSY